MSLDRLLVPPHGQGNRTTSTMEAKPTYEAPRLVLPPPRHRRDATSIDLRDYLVNCKNNIPKHTHITETPAPTRHHHRSGDPRRPRRSRTRPTTPRAAAAARAGASAARPPRAKSRPAAARHLRAARLTPSPRRQTNGRRLATPRRRVEHDVGPPLPPSPRRAAGHDRVAVLLFVFLHVLRELA